jgi:hypothetical protein
MCGKTWCARTTFFRIFDVKYRTSNSTVPCFVPQTYFFLKNLLVKFTWPTAYVLIPSEDLPLVVQNLKKDGSA